MNRKLYLMRHGQTVLNAQHRIQGSCDSPLTKIGKQQAINARDYFERNGVVFDCAYCSTSGRAEETLKLIFSGSYKKEIGLREMNYGSLEGQPELKLTPIQAQTYYLDYGGESSNTVKERMVKTLTEIMSRENHQCVLVVGHGASCFNFLRAFQDPTEELKKGFGNGVIFVYNFDGNTFFLEKVVRQNEM